MVLLALLGSLVGELRALESRPDTAVGRDIGRPDGPRVDPTLAPARVALVAAVPGSDRLETWAYGHTHWRNAGYAQTDPQGQAVFLSRDRTRGWRIEQPLLDAEGRPSAPGVTAFAFAPGGQGWGVGQTGLIFHRPPDGKWKIHEQSTLISNVTLTSIALGRDAGGVYGWAVGPGPTFLTLRDGVWSHDIGSVRGSGGTGDVLGNIVSVAAVTRTVGWAVAGTPRELGLYRRDPVRGWERFQTGNALFDVAPTLQSGSGGTPILNQSSSGTAVATAGGVVWVTGRLQPVDASRYVSQRGPGTDPFRPYALRIDPGGAITTYCSPIYQLSGGGVESTSALCDEPFPLAAGSLPALHAVSRGEVFAGGAFGMFRFTGGAWRREPNVAGQISSLTFHSANEGWVASYGNRSNEGGGLAASTSATLGHWTSARRPAPMTVRWPHPSRETLEGVALHPAGNGAAFAVGHAGVIVRSDPGVGWDVVASPTDRPLHDVAWPAARQAWAVGERGVILRFDGRRWHEDPASRRVTGQALYKIAFRTPSDGVAVGAKGTILRYDGARWRLDLRSGAVTDQRLMGVAFAGDDAIAVGEGSTILVDEGSGWKIDATAPGRLKTLQEGRFPSLFTVAGLPDGRAFIGGELSILLERAPGGLFDRATSVPMISGGVLSLAATESQGKVRLLASIATEPTGRVNKFGGSGLIEPTGWLFASDGSGWRAVGEQRVADYLDPNIDGAVRRDAVYGIAVDSTGRGFAVGGYPADLQDDDNHTSSLPSASIWSLALDGAPDVASNHSRVPVRTAPGSVGFAFLADTACATGLCSATSGLGARADEVLARALKDVETSATAGDVRFVAFGGDMRRLGVPDELAPIRRMLDSLTLPSFAAIGDQDLFGGVDAAGDSVLASNGYYLQAFADRPRPWGHGNPLPRFVPVEIAGEPATDLKRARTHYAFDYTIGGRALMRVIFMDTSRTAQEVPFQNPPADQDSAWLRPLLDEANSSNVPSVVVMHKPLIASIATGGRTGTLTSALTGAGVSAVLAADERVNRLIRYADPVTPFPVAILGTTGAPLKGGWDLGAGAYHAWFHVSVPIDGGDARIASIPVLESVALSAPQGRSSAAGRTLRFTGLARLPDVGGNDPQADRAQYLEFPMQRPCAGPLENPSSAPCVAADAFRPDHTFACEDARICTFVREDPARVGVPWRNASGQMVRDAHSGLMCSLAPGQTFVALRVGIVKTRVPVTVGTGGGPCIPAHFASDPSRTKAVADRPRAGAAQVDDTSAPLLKSKSLEIAAIPALAPPPVQPAPAPPGGGAPKYEEERESATETAEMSALEVRSAVQLGRRAHAHAWPPLAGAALGIGILSLAMTVANRARAERSPLRARSTATARGPRAAYEGSAVSSHSRNSLGAAWRSHNRTRPYP